MCICREFSDHICHLLLDSITKAIKECNVEKDPIYEEVQSHAIFCHQKAAAIFGREKVLSKVQKYIEGSSEEPFVIHGPSGSGKTSVMAKAVLQSLVR